MPVVAELRNVIIGDDTNWRAAAARTQESLAQLQAQANQATVAIGTAFAGMSGSVAGAAASFETLGVQAAAAGATITSSANSAAASIAPLEGAAVSAASGMTALGSSAIQAGAGVGELAARKAQLVGELTNVNAAIRSETSVLAGAQSAVANLGTSHTALNSAVLDSEAKLGGYIAQQTLLKAELGTVNTALRGAAAAQTATTATQVAAGTATEALGQKTGILQALMQGHTTQITSQGTVWRGYDNVLQAVIRTMGGIPVIAALGITILGVLAEKMLHSKDAAKDLKDISDELIQSDLLLASAFSALQEATGSTTKSFIDQANAYRSLIEVDVGAVIVKFAESFKQSQEEIKKSEQALASYQQAQAGLNDIMQLAEGSQIDYSDSLKVAQSLLNSSSQTLNNETAAREKNEQEMRKATEALLALYNSGARTIPQLEEMARSALGAGAAFDRLQAELLKATSAQEQLNAASANYRPPKLDTTLQTYDQLRTAVNANITDLEKAGRSQAEILIAVKPQLEAVKKATIEKAAADLTAAKASITSAAGQKFLAEELGRGGDKAAEYAGKLPALDKNIKALSSSTDAHAKSAKAAHSAVSQYAEGVIGLGKAFDTVAGALSTGAFSKLFDDLPAKARKGLDGIKQAAQQVVKELEDLMKHVTSEGFKFSFSDKDLKPTIASLEALGAAGVTELKKVSEASKTVQEELIKLKIAALNLKQPIFEIPFEVMRDGFGNITEAGKRLIKVVQDAGGVIKTVLPGTSVVISSAMVESVDKLNDSAAAVEAWTKVWQKSFFDAQVPLTPFKQALKDLKTSIEDSMTFDNVRIQNEAAQLVDGVIKQYEELGVRMGETQDQINARVLKGIQDEFGPQFVGAFAKIGDQTVKQWADSINKLPGALDTAVNKMLDALGIFAAQSRIKVKGAVDGVLLIMDAIPGKLHDTAQAFIDWVNRIDQIFRGLHKIFQQIPDGLGGVLQSIIGIFKKTTATITDGTKDLASALGETVSSVMGSISTRVTQGTRDLADALGESVDSVLGSIGKGGDKAGSSFLSGFMGKVALIGSGIATFFASRGANGAVTPASIAGAALAGAQIGAAFAGPFGAAIGAVIGAAVGGFRSKNPFVRFFTGGIFSAIFGGPSDEQKAAEEKAKKEAEAHIEQVTMEVLHTAFDAMQSALELFEKLADFTKVPTKNIHRFFNQLEIVLQEFVELSKHFEAGMADAAKAFAESIGPIVEVIGNSIDAFEKLGGFTGVAQVSIDSFSSAMTRVLQSFIGIKDKFLDAEGFIDTTVNQARKFAAKIGGVIDVIKNALDAFSGFQTFKNVLPETLDAFAATLQLAINKMGEIAEAVDKAMIKQAARFSDRAIAVVNLVKTALDAFGPLATFAAVPAEAMEALFAGISSAVARMQDLASTLDTEMLTRAVAVADKASAIFGAIKSGVDSLTSLADFKAVAPEAFQALLDGFNQAVTILNQMLEKATQFESISAAIKTKLESAAQNLRDGAAAMAAGVAAATSALNSSVPSGGTASAPTSAGLGPLSRAAASSTSSTSTVINQPIHVNLTVQGPLGTSIAQLQDYVVGAITEAQRRGRLSTA